MTKVNRAKMLLVEIEALQTGDYEGRVQDMLMIVNHIIRDAQVLAKEVAGDESQELEKKAA
jgi:hypothetical protein